MSEQFEYLRTEKAANDKTYRLYVIADTRDDGEGGVEEPYAWLIERLDVEYAPVSTESGITEGSQRTETWQNIDGSGEFLSISEARADGDLTLNAYLAAIAEYMSPARWREQAQEFARSTEDEER